MNLQKTASEEKPIRRLISCTDNRVDTSNSLDLEVRNAAIT